ncbi:hypothetical protein BEN49_02705 [Hymenobacter coccineus]|uniref:DUF4142 domain-containing protein n=1 Tax=Hymenobacter coccineus TaxID=1908235 RepID=A0A1G1SU06_9BACT|nr:hypothetical protein BEN49_02705 [Hymenobacter coccineus]
MIAVVNTVALCWCVANASKIAPTMPTEADIQRAAQRIQNGDGIISTVLQMKNDAIEALRTGDMTKLKKAGSNTFSFNAASL